MLYYLNNGLRAIAHAEYLLQFSHSSNNPRDDIATEAYEDELDMGRSGSYLNSSINSAWSEHSLDPEDIRVRTGGAFCLCQLSSLYASDTSKHVWIEAYYVHLCVFLSVLKKKRMYV